MPDFAALREQMVTLQLEQRGIREPAILNAFRSVPRERFVADELAPHAYADGPLPIGSGQTISQPYIVALMIQAAGIKPGDQVLEVGAGSGYAAAVASRIADEIVAIERHPDLAAEARDRLKRLGFDNVLVVQGDGTKGWPEGAPFDSILIAAAGSEPPPALLEQLRPAGRMIIPVGPHGGMQNLLRLTKHQDGSIRRDELCAVRFVPLVAD